MAGIFLASAPLAFAETLNPCPPGQFSPLCNFTSANFGKLLGNLITLAFIIAVVVALAYLIYGGVRWIMSGGDKAALDSARNHIVAAILGLIVVFLAFFILNILIGFFLPGVSLSSLTLPSAL